MDIFKEMRETTKKKKEEMRKKYGITHDVTTIQELYML